MRRVLAVPAFMVGCVFFLCGSDAQVEIPPDPNAVALVGTYEISLTPRLDGCVQSNFPQGDLFWAKGLPPALPPERVTILTIEQDAATGLFYAKFADKKQPYLFVSATKEQAIFNLVVQPAAVWAVLEIGKFSGRSAKGLLVTVDAYPLSRTAGQCIRMLDAKITKK